MAENAYSVYAKCPACGADQPKPVRGVKPCVECGALLGRAVMNTVERHVKVCAPMENNDGRKPIQFFDFFVVDILYPRRIHGAFNTETGRVVQWG